jgi:hypothetical protein
MYHHKKIGGWFCPPNDYLIYDFGVVVNPIFQGSLGNQHSNYNTSHEFE